MNEIERIVDQLTRAVEGNAWHGPSIKELLSEIDHSKAALRPVPDAHSIWELVNHITAWQKAAVSRINGEVKDLSDEEDWPAVTDVSEQSWKKTLEEFDESYKILKHEILDFPNDKLDDKIGDKDQTYYILFHGIIQHNLYHAGQIGILRKKF